MPAIPREPFGAGTVPWYNATGPYNTGSTKEDDMSTEDHTNFDKLAAQWDQNPVPVRIALGVGEAIVREAGPTRGMDVLDFGCGTGLVTLRLQPLVGTITGADSSPGMIEKLREKCASQGITNVRTQLVDFENNGRVKGTYHLVVSSMTLHHVQDTAALFRHWFELLKPEGTLCVADLDMEDGTFHRDNTGVFHTGFDREALTGLLAQIGLCDVRDTTATRIVRDVEGKGEKEFSVFLITGKKPKGRCRYSPITVKPAVRSSS